MSSSIMFYSSNTIWGGSEVLWFRAAIKLGESTEVSMIADYSMQGKEHIKSLPGKNITVHFFNKYRNSLILNRFMRAREEIKRILKKSRPSMVILSLGSHYLIGHLPSLCSQLGIPYVLIFQLVNDTKWVETESKWKEYRNALQGAKACYFVSDGNQKAIEKMIAAKLTNGRRIHNPFQVNFNLPFSYPSIDSGYKLANVARFSVGHKGQDVLLEVLAQEKWKSRNLEVHFIGNGSCKSLIQELIRYYDIRNAYVQDYMNDITKLWSMYHGLILPSRREGSSLALMEAMVMGRVPVCTRVGSAPEMIKDNDTGFLAKYCYPEFVDDALERAWNDRENWPSIGKKNYDLARVIFKEDPVDTLSNELLRMANTK